MKLSTLITVIAVVVFSMSILSGCKKSSPEQKAIGFIKGMTKVMKDNMSDPDKAGDALTNFMKDNKSVIEELKALKGKPDTLKNNKEFAAAMKDFTAVMMKMAMDPKFQKSKKFQDSMKSLKF